MYKNEIIFCLLFVIAAMIVWRAIKRHTQTSLNPEDTRFMVLVILRDNGSWMYGLDIVSEIQKEWGKDTRAIIYVALSHMEDNGEVESRETSLRGRREYQIKENGRKALEKADSRWLKNISTATQF